MQRADRSMQQQPAGAAGRSSKPARVAGGWEPARFRTIDGVGQVDAAGGEDQREEREDAEGGVHREVGGGRSFFGSYGSTVLSL